MTASGLDTAQNITGNITSLFCSLSSIGIIAMIVSTDPKVRKGSMGVIALWFLLCIINIIISSINAERKGISLIDSIKGDTSTGSSSFSSFLSSSSFFPTSSSSSSSSFLRPSSFFPTSSSSSSFLSSSSSGSSSR